MNNKHKHDVENIIDKILLRVGAERYSSVTWNEEELLYKCAVKVDRRGGETLPYITVFEFTHTYLEEFNGNNL